MLSFEYLQKQIGLDIQSRYTKKVFESPSLAELGDPTKAFFSEVASLVFPDKLVVLQPKEKPP